MGKWQRALIRFLAAVSWPKLGSEIAEIETPIRSRLPTNWHVRARQVGIIILPHSV